MKSFLALLVFLYTDTVPTNMMVSDYRELLVLADRFCLPQLISVCEGAIVDRISSEIKKKRLNSAQCNDVINLLLTGQVGVYSVHIVSYYGRRGGLMVSALDSRASGPRV